MTTTATRLITLIMLLQRQPNQKAADLAEALGVSVRTLHRYIGMLDELGIPVYSERGPQGGFSLVRGYKMPPLVFSPSEAAAICLGAGLVANLWGALFDDAARSALAKLENLLPHEQLAEVEWARRALITGPLQRPGLQTTEPRLEILQRALRARKRIRLIYQGGAQIEPLERDFDTYALAFRQGWWYIIGYCHLRGAVRSFRLDRIRRFEVLDCPYDIPADFDAHTHLDFEAQFEARIHFKMRFDPEFAFLATSTPAAWESVEAQPDGSVMVTGGATDMQWAAVFVLSYGPAATVVEPEALRVLVAKWAAEVAARYSR